MRVTTNIPLSQQTDKVRHIIIMKRSTQSATEKLIDYSGRLIDPQFVFSIFLYLVFLVLFYFKGLKGDGSGLPIFVTIILYIYSLGWFFLRPKSDILKSKKQLLIFISLFYLLNLTLIYTYFDPFHKATSLDADGNKLNVTDYKPIIFSFIAIAGLLGIILYFVLELGGISSSSEYLINLLKLTSVLFILGGIISISIYLFLYTPWPITIISSILNIFILILSLSLIYKFFNPLKSKTTIKQPSTFSQFIKAFIFYIPCLFIKFIDSIKNEYNISTKTELLILFIELIFIGFRILLPYLYKLYNKLFKVNGDIIETGPIYLNKEYVFGIIKNKDIKSENSGKKPNPDNYNYAISAWIWINPQPPSTSSAYNKSTSLFNYGNVLQINFVKNNIEILASTTHDGEISESLVKIYKTENFYYQKWNNILLNYSGGTLDVFINNELVASSINITPIMYNNKVTTGSNNGIHGGIKDIVYYNKVLSRNEINSIYNL